MDIQIIRSNRKTVSLEIKKDLSVVVRAPLRMREDAIRAFVAAKEQWLQKHLASVKQQAVLQPPVPFTAEELCEMKKRAAAVLPARVQHWAQKMGVDYKKITLRKQISRWGSCSSDGSLSLNCLLVLLPDAVMDYIIVHELCHRWEMNHSPRFWQAVAGFCPDYRQQQAWLCEKGSALIRRMRES